jgi:RecB family endonuclease NucS
MKLNRILDQLNSFEKNSFLKIIDVLLASKPKNAKEIERILSANNRDIKNADHQNIAAVFNLLEDEFIEHISKEFLNTSSQFDVLIDIITREGCGIVKLDWFSRLYDKECKTIAKKVKELQAAIENEKSDLDEYRKRDYRVYSACLRTAYFNDEANNLDKKVSTDELSILLTLVEQLELAQEEVKLINYSIIPLKQMEVDKVVNDLKNIGAIFFSKKTNTIYVADEVARVLRKVRGKVVADKHYRRVLRQLRDPQINMICKKHGLDWRLSTDEKVNQIIKCGVPFNTVLSQDIFKDDVKLLERRKFINELCDEKLLISPSLKGSTIDEKINNLIAYFEEVDKDDRIGISHDGFDKMLAELGESLPKLNNLVRAEYEWQEENVLKGAYLLDYNIKPRDLLELLPESDLLEFCKARSIKSRGDLVANVLENYKDAENLYLENYHRIGARDLAGLKENGIVIKEADLGVKFEELTRLILTKLGFDVDEKLRKSLNTAKDQIDIVVRLSENELIIIECKSAKDSGYNKFSSVSRQLKAYVHLAQSKNFKVVKSLLVAPEFSDDFVKECGLEYELNLSLLSASGLVKILNGFKKSRHKQLPHTLLMKDVLIQEDRILKAIEK